MKCRDKQAGFTLPELAIVLVLFGFAASTVLLALNTYTTQQRIERTKTATDVSRNAINAWAKANGRYPCPARITADEGDADYGYDITWGLTPEISVLDPSDLTPGGERDQILALLNAMPQDNGQIDLDGDGPNESFIVGAIPYKTLLNANDTGGVLSLDVAFKELEFGTQHISDGWNNKLTYAISRHLCDPTPDNNLRSDPRGVIDVVIDRTCTTAGGDEVNVSLLPGEGDCKQDNKRYAQFIIIAHGENSRGAHNSSTGNEVINCLPGAAVVPPPPGGLDENLGFHNGYASDKMNCDYDGIDNPNEGNEGIFFSGLRSEDDDRYFDDTIKFFFEDSTTLWEQGSGIYMDNGTPDDTSDDYLVSQINNTNLGNIGVGTDNPQEQMQVDGDVQAFDIYAEGFCDERSSGEVCMNAATLAGNEPEMQCPTGTVVRRIQNNTVECENPFEGASFACGTNSSGVQLYLQAVYSDGRTTCCDVTNPDSLVCTTE